MELQITYRHFDTSDALSAHVKTAAEKLEKLGNDLRSCKVVIEEPHQRSGRAFHVRVLVEASSHEIVGEHEDLNAYVAATEAFRAVERQVRSHEEKRRKDVKRHSLPSGE